MDAELDREAVFGAGTTSGLDRNDGHGFFIRSDDSSLEYDFALAAARIRGFEEL